MGSVHFGHAGYKDQRGQVRHEHGHNMLQPERYPFPERDFRIESFQIIRYGMRTGRMRTVRIFIFHSLCLGSLQPEAAGQPAWISVFSFSDIQF